MAEIWGAAIMVGGAVVSGIAASKKEKDAQKANRELTKDSAKYEALLSEFDRDSDFYYNQLNRENKQRGLAEFKKFSTLLNHTPEYVNTSPGIIVPNKPNAANILNEQSATATSLRGGSGTMGTFQPAIPEYTQTQIR